MFLVLCVTCDSEILDPAAQCHLVMKDYTFEYEYSQEGDIIIGGIFTVHSWVTQWRWKGSRDYNRMCSGIYPREYTHLLAFLFAIEATNKRSDILPNVTLGYHIYDSCGHVNKVIKDVLQIMSRHTVTAPNYSCMEKDAVIGFIGDLHSETTLSMARLLSLYGYTQISYGARDPLLSDKRLYPNFFRTVPDDKIQYSALVKLLERFQWNWVGIITSDDDSGRQELQQLIKKFTHHQICVEFSILVSQYTYKHLPVSLQTSSTDVIIICGTYSITYIKFLYDAVDVLNNKTLILPISWSHATELVHYIEGGVPANCSLVFSPHSYNITGMQEYFSKVHFYNQPSDMLLEDIWMAVFQCFSRNKLKNLLIPYTYTGIAPFHNCSGEERFHGDVFYFPSDLTPYQVYMAVLLMAQALHNIDIALHNHRKHNISVGEYKYKLTEYIKRLHSQDALNGMLINEKGESFSPLYIVNWVVRLRGSRGSSSKTTVGIFDPSHPDLLNITPARITWRQNLRPKGRCSELCPPGTRKILREGHHICCYDCVPCSEGEFTNVTDTENCQRCPDHEWPNEGKNKCVVRDDEFFSYETDVLALVFSIISTLLSLITFFIIGIFSLFQKSPIVRANNQNLSFILLTSLMFSLLCVFLFIGRPVDITCMLQQICFGIFFTVAVSSVLAKTIIVCIAFKATRPDSSWRKCMGVKLPYSVVLVCSSIQVLNALIWLSVSPPYQELNLDYPRKIILQCNEGSILAFYLMLGYMGFLAALSFVLAFMVRTLPDIYNEAKFITFSMLVFCSVWICSIPAYLSSSGKHMVIVEIFAILSSGGGILTCMFLPKCYNILINRKVSSKGQLLEKCPQHKRKKKSYLRVQ
ncbi:vomeronasal type-2 receptor 26-like [Bufo bufo]|uniref:vomeronasal type-2 receptor 26-like n=1 Tax=Bufo bufo TaxID=8384 RepID=UPI001ABE529A|nr:vomeronasal type-2 receptor 26-like [Bufo bufo]